MPRDKTFYFSTSIGNFTGESAGSLREFSEKINQVNVKSLEFHLQRGDFENWIGEVLGDTELAGEIRDLKGLNLSGEELRKRLYTIISNRLRLLNILKLFKRAASTSPTLSRQT